MNFLDHDEIEWGDCRLDIAGARLVKFTGIDVTVGMEKELLYAEGTKPRGTQSGNEDYQIELSMLVGALCDLNDYAISQGFKNILHVKLPIVLQFAPKGARKRRLFRLVNVSFSKFNLAMMQNDKKMEVKLPGVFEDLIYVPVV